MCIGLYKQYLQENSEKPAAGAKYDLFYPLVKRGLVEFYGENKFKISPSCALYSDKYLLICNVPFFLHHKIKETALYDDLGIKVYHKSRTLLNFLKDNVIPNSKFELWRCLKAIPSFETIIHSWADDIVIDSTTYYFLNKKNTWDNNSLKPSIGIFKKSSEVYATRTFKLSENQWKYIPLNEYNIDGFNIAATIGQIKNNWNLEIRYYVNEANICINSIFFPILIERFLFLNTLLEGRDCVDISKRCYFIKQKDFDILNKLFDNKIQSV